MDLKKKKERKNNNNDNINKKLNQKSIYIKQLYYTNKQEQNHNKKPSQTLMISLLTTESLSKSKLRAMSGSKVLMEQFVTTPPSSSLYKGCIINTKVLYGFYIVIINTIKSPTLDHEAKNSIILIMIVMLDTMVIN